MAPLQSIAIEAAWYDWCMSKASSGRARPDGDKAEGLFSDISPRRTDGSLHIGHALTTAIQDALVRWWVAGELFGLRLMSCLMLEVSMLKTTLRPRLTTQDSTQSVVEKRLFKTEGRTRQIWVARSSWDSLLGKQLVFVCLLSTAVDNMLTDRYQELITINFIDCAATTVVSPLQWIRRCCLCFVS